MTHYVEQKGIAWKLTDSEKEILASHREDYLCFSYYASNTISAEKISPDAYVNEYLVQGAQNNPYIKATVQEDFPRVFITRRILKDGARYFGPYTNATAVHESLKLLRRLFPLRTCKHLQERPCLEYHIKRCLAPCAGKVEKGDYDAMIRAVLLFLEGRTEDVEKELQLRMEQAAESFHFEIAARLRDQLLAVHKVAEKQNIVTGSGDQDAIGLARSEIGVVVQVFMIRGGKMIGREHFLLQGSEDESDGQVLAAFLQQYYHRATFIPREILLPLEIPQLEQEL